MGPRVPGPWALGPRVPGLRGRGPRVPGPRAPGLRVPGPRAPGPRVPGPRAPGPRVPGPGAPGPRVPYHIRDTINQGGRGGVGLTLFQNYIIFEFRNGFYRIIQYLRCVHIYTCLVRSYF